MAALMIACARHAGVTEARLAAPRSTALSMRYEATEAVAQEQREAYFALMPSKARSAISSAAAFASSSAAASASDSASASASA